MNRFVKLTCGLLFISLALSGQTSDFGAWYELNADYKLGKGFRADFESSIRTDENASHIETFYFEPGIRYKINDNFSAGLYYRFIEQREDDEKFYPRHRWFIQLKGDLPAGRFTFSARYRLQEQFKTYIEDPEDEIPSWYHRLRLEADYDVPAIPLSPYISAELHSQLFTSNDIMIEKMRYMAGIDYTVKKKHTFGIAYVFNKSLVTKPEKMNIVALRYGIKL